MYQVIIIGGGPAGLNLALELQKRNCDFLLIESEEYLGGQLPSLYPNKEIVDIPGIESILAKDYISLLCDHLNFSKIHFDETVEDIEEKDSIIVKTNKNTYLTNKVVIATGLGFHAPRPLGVEHEKECSNILYSLKDFSFLKDKKVAIFGGGDSALDWAKEISKISNFASLIHRRTEFRGDANTIKSCKNLNVFLPYVPKSIKFENNRAKSIFIQNVNDENDIKEIEVDYILVNYGQISEQPKFNIPRDGNFFKVNENQRSAGNIYCIGDACSYDQKKRRIAPLLNEIKQLITHLFC